MGFPVDNQFGLSLRFADFDLLPDLLDGIKQKTESEVIDTWRTYLAENECNTDHIDNTNEESPESLAIDVSRLVYGLELASSRGLTDAGIEIAQLSEIPRTERDSQHDRLLRVALANRIESCYFNPDFSLGHLLQDAANRLAASELPDAQVFPGLLLVEVQVLIELAHLEPDSVSEWIDKVDSIRETAISNETTAQFDVDRADDLQELVELLGREDALAFSRQISISDAITLHYEASTMDLSLMPMTELRTTTMLFAFAGFLEIRNPLGPVQYLSVPQSSPW